MVIVVVVVVAIVVVDGDGGGGVFFATAGVIFWGLLNHSLFRFFIHFENNYTKHFILLSFLLHHIGNAYARKIIILTIVKKMNELR